MLRIVKRVTRFFRLFFNAANYEGQSCFQIRRSVHKNVAAPDHNLTRCENNTASGQVLD
jgi:hypothetical protein